MIGAAVVSNHGPGPEFEEHGVATARSDLAMAHKDAAWTLQDDEHGNQCDQGQGKNEQHRCPDDVENTKQSGLQRGPRPGSLECAHRLEACGGSPANGRSHAAPKGRQDFGEMQFSSPLSARRTARTWCPTGVRGDAEWRLVTPFIGRSPVAGTTPPSRPERILLLYVSEPDIAAHERELTSQGLCHRNALLPRAIGGSVTSSYAMALHDVTLSVRRTAGQRWSPRSTLIATLGMSLLLWIALTWAAVTFL